MVEEVEKNNGLNGDIKNSPLTNEEKAKVQKNRWKNRRRMAWISIFCLVSLILLFFFAPIDNARLAIIADPVSMLGWVFGMVISAYMGFTTIEKYKMGK